MRRVRAQLLVLTVAAVAALGAFSPEAAVYLPVMLDDPRPTATATWAPSPTAVASATPTRSSVAGKEVSVLDNYSAYTGSWSDLTIAGEVRNNTSGYVRNVRVAVNVFGDGGQLVATDVGYIDLTAVAPGEHSCFEIDVYPAPSAWAYFRFEAPTYDLGGELLPPLTAYNHSGSYAPSEADWYQIIGLVRNDGDARVIHVRPIGTLYDGNGRVVGCDTTLVHSEHLDPGQSSGFSMLFFGRDYTDVASYRLQVDGRLE